MGSGHLPDAQQESSLGPTRVPVFGCVGPFTHMCFIASVCYMCVYLTVLVDVCVCVCVSTNSVRYLGMCLYAYVCFIMSKCDVPVWVGVHACVSLNMLMCGTVCVHV